MRKPASCICKNKDADRLRGNSAADQRLCFRYINCTDFLLSNPICEVSSQLLWLYSPVFVGPGRKHQDKFSRRGSYEGRLPKTLIIESLAKFVRCNQQLQRRMHTYLNVKVMLREKDLIFSVKHRFLFHQAVFLRALVGTTLGVSRLFSITITPP